MTCTPTAARRAPRRWTAAALTVVLAVTAGCSGTPQSNNAATGAQTSTPAPPRVTAVELDKRIQAFFDLSYNDAYRNVRAVVVMVHGRPLLERYYNNGSAAQTSNVYSVTKTVMSMLVGIALDEGHLRSVDQTLEELLPTYAAKMSPQVKATTLRQVLTMTAGLPEGTAAGGFNFVTTPDWVAAILANPERTPGHSFIYSNGSSHLMSAIVATAAQRSTLQYAREKLFGPLGIDSEPAAELPAKVESIPAYNKAAFAWPKDPQGHHTGFSYLKLTARDMAKLGQLWLDKGRWQGRQLVSQAWVAESTRPHVATRGAGFTDHYGYQWWVTDVNNHPAYAAMGYGGQLVEVVPHLGLVVAVSSTAEETGNANPAELVSEVIVPALT